MRILALVYQPDAGPGVFSDAAAARGTRIDEWLVPERAEPPAEPASYDAVMTFGGSMHVDQEDRHRWLASQRELLGELAEQGTPLLGLCLGAQILCRAVGGDVRRMPEPEIGWFETHLTAAAADDPLLGGMPERFLGFNWHSYECVPPPDAAVLARSDACVHAFRAGERAWGVQFHAEVSGRDANSWIDEWDEDPDAVRIGLDPDALRVETDRNIPAWNEIGRALCGRFLDAVAAPALRG